MENQDFYLPVEIYSAVIKKYSKRGGDESNFLENLYPRVHQAFFEAQKKYPKEMSRFRFKKTIHPYSVSLDGATISYAHRDKSSGIPKKDFRLEEIAEFIVDRLSKSSD